MYITQPPFFMNKARVLAVVLSVTFCSPTFACIFRDIGKTFEKAYKDTVNTVSKAKQDTDKAIDKAVDDASVATKKALKDAVNTADKAAKDTATTTKKAEEDTSRAIDKAVDDSAVALKKVLKDMTTAVDKGQDDTAKAAKKAGRDIGNEVVRTPANLERNRLALNRYVERELSGIGDSLTDAERRLREGKVVDALWHLGTDPIRHTEENAAKLVQEAALVRAVAQAAATAYGGPGGSAAFAAWYTFRATKDPELALRVGMITGAASWASSAAGAMPATTGAEVARKAIVTGAIGGLTVAASGGSEADIREGFALSAGMVLVKDGYKAVTQHELDARSSYDEAYCMSSEPGKPCSPPDHAYSLDENGKLVTDEYGRPKVDIRKTDPRRPHVGRWSSPADASVVGERSSVMTTISRVPGMNAMALFHDQWSVSWDMSTLTSIGTIGPAIVLTYVGIGTPFFDLLQKTNIEVATEKKQSSPRPSQAGPTKSPEPALLQSPTPSPTPSP
jgi:hypothetical protein